MKLFPFGRRDANLLPSDDRGSGTLDDYDYELRPKRRGETLLGLAGSRPHQDELTRVLALGDGDVSAVIPRRTPEEDRVDAPMPVRLFAAQRPSAQRPSALVGFVPRGLENVVDAALARLSEAGASPRIPARIVKARGGLRVHLLMHETRG